MNDRASRFFRIDQPPFAFTYFTWLRITRADAWIKSGGQKDAERRGEWLERHWVFSIISVGCGDFSGEIREARGFFADQVTRLDYAETGAPWRETGEAEGGLTSLGESLAPRGRHVLRLQESLHTASVFSSPLLLHADLGTAPHRRRDQFLGPPFSNRQNPI